MGNPNSNPTSKPVTVAANVVLSNPANGPMTTTTQSGLAGKTVVATPAQSPVAGQAKVAGSTAGVVISNPA
jgi:hypothetical protein